MHSVGDLITFKDFNKGSVLYRVSAVFHCEKTYHVVPVGSVNNPCDEGRDHLGFIIDHETLPICISKAKTSQKVYEDYKDLFI